MQDELRGRGALVTGATQGLGFAIARAFIDAGASVLVCARTPVDVATAVDRLKAHATTAGQKVVGEVADISSEADAHRLVTAAERELGGVDILANNAGVIGPIGPTDDIDWPQWRQAIAVNLIGAAYLTHRVVPLMKPRGGKILFLSGGGATAPDPNFTAYATSKGGLIAFAASLAAEVEPFRIDVNTIAPGGLVTRMLDQRLRAGRERVGTAVYDTLVERQKRGGDPVERAAALAVFLAGPRSKGISGRLISATWDDWERLVDRADLLRDSDIYTLRRILPKDRGYEW
jgi:3-oxoacyl-[acyl-carrier protein] reductase